MRVCMGLVWKVKFFPQKELSMFGIGKNFQISNIPSSSYRMTCWNKLLKELNILNVKIIFFLQYHREQLFSSDFLRLKQQINLKNSVSDTGRKLGKLEF